MLNVRSGCFGSTSDAAYSLVEKLVNNVGELSDGNIVADASALTENSQDFIIFLFGSERGQQRKRRHSSTSTYTTGDQFPPEDQHYLFLSLPRWTTVLLTIALHLPPTTPPRSPRPKKPARPSEPCRRQM